MLLQKNVALCRSWQGKLSHFKTSTLLHHGKQYTPPCILYHQMPQRSFRTFIQLQKSAKPVSLQKTPFENVHDGPVPRSNIVKALVFTGAFSTGCFLSATIMEYENTRSMMIERAKRARSSFHRIIPNSDHGKRQSIKNELNHFWEQLTPGERVFVPLCALNLLVFGMWRVPKLRQTMMTYFCSNPVGRAVCWPMFLSTFSHYSVFHIFANMYVLHSFSNAAVLSLGKEQFLAVYLSAGVIASLSSFLYKAVTSQAGLSLGASGAIMAILAFVCAQYPDTQLSILFLPTITFSAGAAIKVIMGIDFLGCILGLKFFDHAAHLGGALFGIFWAYYGTEVWQKRLPFLTLYHDWRKTK